MKAFSTSFVLLTVVVCSVAAQGNCVLMTPVFPILRENTEVLHPGKIGVHEDDQTLDTLVNRGGWVNPEDLIPMPQCIAQQNYSSWLGAITKCTGKRCTSHFGVICTHHQWLTQLSCLSTEISSEIVRAYLPYCSRSVLAKAQLYRWIRTVTDRTWLVDVGDANGLQSLSPASLTRGYATMDVTNKAPTCLKDSASASSMEPFQRIMASCAFASNTQHTGNAARPWEYSESLRSVIALDSETVGYDVTQHSIRYGDYFDKQCFCDAFSIDLESEPCSVPGLASTRERLWLNATCGSTSLPINWTDGLQTTTYAYIPTEKWRWPDCVASMPKKVIGLTDRCATDACESDSNGFCKIKRSIDRACFCRNISYSICKGSCHIFETRINYVTWLHDLCGGESGWHGLPKHWRQLAAPTPLDMIPWRWSIKPFKDSKPTPINHSKSLKPMHACASTEWKLGSLVLINLATSLAGLFRPRNVASPITRMYLRYLHSQHWILGGFSIAALHLCANWLNAVLIQSTLGYADVPITQMILLWCSMPRFTWLTVLLVVFQPLQATTFSTVKSFLFAESILQMFSAYHMITAVSYGREHGFYSQGMARLDRVLSARCLYAGALMWLLVTVAALALLLQAICRAKMSTRGARFDGLEPRTDRRTIPSVLEELVALFNIFWTRFEESLLRSWLDESWVQEQPLSTSSEEQIYTVYGTLPSKVPENQIIEQGMVRLFLIAIASMIFLWIAQWLFWAGFIGLSMEE